MVIKKTRLAFPIWTHDNLGKVWSDILSCKMYMASCNLQPYGSKKLLRVVISCKIHKTANIWFSKISPIR